MIHTDFHIELLLWIKVKCPLFFRNGTWQYGLTIIYFLPVSASLDHQTKIVDTFPKFQTLREIAVILDLCYFVDDLEVSPNVVFQL